LPKRGNSSLWKREVGRDFADQCRYYYETVNKSENFLLTSDLKLGFSSILNLSLNLNLVFSAFHIDFSFMV